MFSPEEQDLHDHLSQAWEMYYALPPVSVGLDVEGPRFQEAIEDAKAALYARLGRRAQQEEIQVNYLTEELKKLRREKDAVQQEKQTEGGVE